MDIKNINLMNDALFKAIMCHKNNRKLVIDLLHVLTGIDKIVLKNATFIGGEEIPKRKISQKKQMTDMTLRLENKHRIIIEMNYTDSKNIFEKNSAYAFSVVIETTKKNLEKYPKVILINIDNFNKYETEKPILEFKIRDSEGHIETDLYYSIHLVLDNILKSSYNINEEIKKFAKFLKENNLEELAREFKGDEKYMACIRTVEDLTTDPELIGYYDYEEAKKQELIDAKELAMEQGVEIGVKKANVETAKALLSMKVNTIEQIARATKLSIDEVKKLQKECLLTS